MKIYELLKQLNDRFPTPIDKERMVENFFKRKDDLHINDLDLALVFVGMRIHFGSIDIRDYFTRNPELLNAIVDSSYAQVFAPSLFQVDVVTVNDDERNKQIRNTVLENIVYFKINQQGVETVDNHELLTEIDIKLLDITKSKLINASDKIKIEVHCNTYYSFALSQTKYKLISDIIITNLSEEVIKDAKLVLIADPAYVEISSINVPLINPQQPISISEFDVNAHIEQLMELKEKMCGQLTVKLLTVAEEELVSATTDLEYYSYDTWLESRMNGSTALFITPNDVAIQNAVALVAKELEKLTGSSALPDYQFNDKNNVASQLKALYNVLHREGIAYITVPPSYEAVGQKVRLPHDVLVHKQGTCLDLAILFLACVERMGLNGFLVQKSGHSLAGVFLEEDNFPTMVYEDAPHAYEMSSEQNNDVLFIECTCYTAGNTFSFEEAIERGREQVNSSYSDQYFAIIDIKRARAQGFLPLPINYNDLDRAVVDYEVVKQNQIRLARKEYSFKGDKIELTEAELNKFDIWEKKLLDLSRRNQLVNYRVNGKGLQIYFYDLNILYHAFDKDEEAYHIVPNKDNPELPFELPIATEEQYKQILDDFNDHNVSVIYRNSQHYTSLRFFEKERKQSFEETGSNIFYLAIGFVRYFETDLSKSPCYAPIVLVPIDLIRHSKDSYSIKGREEPPFLNISAFEFFHQQYHLNCDDLLTQIDFSDENIDINSVLNTVAERMSKLNRASIVRIAAINTFNFSKAVMWADVKFRKKELSKNKVIKSIIDGHYVLDEEEKIAQIFDDDNSNPEDLAIPLPADSSQIMAIQDCAKGKSFILQGPPGTGKSQTITNMIVNAIYHGKTVLFVAEKMAALEVVQKRLNQLCLGKFALEAHSAKADKSSLMAQFDQRIQLGQTAATKENYLTLANQLKEERLKLNRVINLLHKENGYLFSFYDAFVNYLDLDENAPTIPVEKAYIDSLDIDKFSESAYLCEKLDSAIRQSGGYLNNPFILYRNPDFIPGRSKREVIEKSEPYKKQLLFLIERLKVFNMDNELSLSFTEPVINGLVEFLKEDQKYLNIINSLIGTDISSLDTHVTEVINKGKVYQNDLNLFRNDFFVQIYDIDYEHDYAEYRNLETSFFLKRFFGQRKLLKKIIPLCKYPKKYKVKDLPNIYNALQNIKESENQLKQEMSKYQVAFGDVNSINIKEFDFINFETRYLLTKEYIEKYSKCFSTAQLRTLINKVQSFQLKGKDAVLEAIDLVKEASVGMTNIGFDFTLCNKYHFDLEKLQVSLNKLTSRIDYLEYWCSVLKYLKQVKEHNIDFIIGLLEYNDTVTANLEFIYKKSIYGHIINATIVGDESGSFNSLELKEHIDHYKELIERFKELTIKETAARVSALMPSINEKSPLSSQQGILNKAIKNKCRGKAIRQLFAEVPSILTKIFPVFLMSPISCAQYLSPDMPKFDIVIFDEASQMPTSEAIGAIARGKSLIVVGDSKQMPPTAFFQNKGVEDLDSDLDDQQSILDDCDVIGMPSRRLNWHYRSKHESLIRFSNAKFYGNNLITFPSPNDMVTKVSFINTHGVYGERGNATNKIEAQAIVKEVKRRLESPELRKRSIGIVTFSAVQQDVVENLLNDLFAKNHELERYANECKEPLIVKNLENIQGDERDIILFSVCYGPDKTGTMHYRFGPINNVGGERRLNVAVSRARYEMIVFASFEPEILANMKSESRGAQELYNFLRYAKNGAETLTLPNGSAIETKVGFEKQLAKELEKFGYTVHIDIGKSSFRVDLAIVNPDNPKEYILGVLCDSYSYEAALTSNDRNIIQPNALSLLGWNLIRVWSFDYLDNPKKVVDEIINKLKDIKEHPENYQNGVIEEEMHIEFETKEIEQVRYSIEYNAYLKVHNLYGSGEDNLTAKEQIIREILELEAPISEEVLRNRFANALGVTRAGQLIQDDMKACIAKIGAKKNYNHARTKTFYWLEAQCENGKVRDLSYYRVGGLKPRAMDDVPKEEIIVAIKEVLINNGPMFKEELKRYVARAFDIKAVGTKVSEAIDDCVAHYLEKGVLIMVDNNSRVALNNNK